MTYSRLRGITSLSGSIGHSELKRPFFFTPSRNLPATFPSPPRLYNLSDLSFPSSQTTAPQLHSILPPSLSLDEIGDGERDTSTWRTAVRVIMAAKRLNDGFQNEEEQPNEKRMDRHPSFSTVMKEAMMMKQVQHVFMVLEPLLRRVVQEELQAGLVRSPRYIERASPETSPPPQLSSPRAAWKLAFLNPPQLPIFTGSKIEDAHGHPLQVVLLDADTGLPSRNAPQFLRVELVPLIGDFPPADGCREDWTPCEFARGIVKERAGKRPLLTGDVALTMRDGRVAVGELQFTDNSSWLRCRKFRIGARVVQGTGYDGPRVAEAMTEAFNVRDHRGELYRKHYPPALGDDVWRLEKIGKAGAFHQKLAQNNVRTVQEFLQMLTVKPDLLRGIMGDGMTDRMWDLTTRHARTCDAGDRVYAYGGGQPGGVTVYVNSICQLVKIELGGVECAPQQLNRAQKAYVHQLVLEAFEQRASLQEADNGTAMLLHASDSSNSLPMLQNAAPPTLLPPATPLWLQGNSDMDLQIVDELSGQGNFPFQMYDE